MDRATYLLPIKSDVLENTNELTAYLRFLSSVVDIVIVDGSDGPVFASHASEWSGLALHIAPDPSVPGLNGKARGVLSGLRRIVSEKIIIADDDVRYDERSIWLVLEALSSYDVVRPQNYFAPRTWHTLLDSGRTLLN
ncbi:MAG: glycosyltransferase family 2 protein, partial [Candidatus Eremiobacteraeota bacterium]|nr:glycosyltransferase family 2 protein [Candidatus Eremiobacteraeota bacterium]